MMYEKKYIGNTCYISLSSKAELVSTDNSTRIPLSVTEYKTLNAHCRARIGTIPSIHI